MQSTEPRWLEKAPDFLRRRVAGNPDLLEIAENISWLFLDRALKVVLGLVVGIWLARYLGPEQYGILSYAIALVSLFAVLAAAGLNGVVVRELVLEPQNSAAILGTAFLLQILGALLAIALIACTIIWMRPGDESTRIIVSILGAALIFRSADVIRYWFESCVQSRYVVYVETSVYLISAFIKIGMILNNAPLIAFAWMLFAEACLIAVGLFSIYFVRAARPLIWRARFKRMISLLRDSWPLIFSGVAIMIYLRIDQIMLGEMLGQREVGIYSVALRLSEIWYVIPTVITASVFPAIIKLKKRDEVLYLKRIQSLLNMLAAVSLVIAITATLLAGPIIRLLYGEPYAESQFVLMVHVWAGVFVFIGIAGGKWYLVENMQRLTFFRTIAGAVANVFLNLILIPKYGVVGAAWATVVSQALATYFSDVFSSRTRVMFGMKTRAIFYLVHASISILCKRTTRD